MLFRSRFHCTTLPGQQSRQRNGTLDYMTAPVMIREAKPGDVSAVSRLQHQWAREDITYGFVPSDEDAIRGSLGPYFLVAEREDCIVGFIHGEKRISEGLAVVPKGDSYLEIVDLYVEPQYRTQSIGGSLVTRLLELAKRDGIHRASVYSATKDVPSVMRFYQGHGFRGWFVQMFREL